MVEVGGQVAQHEKVYKKAFSNQTSVWYSVHMENVAASIYGNAEVIYRNAPTADAKFKALAERFADAYAWRQEEADALEAMKKRVRILEAEIRAMKEGA